MLCTTLCTDADSECKLIDVGIQLTRTAFVVSSLLLVIQSKLADDSIWWGPGHRFESSGALQPSSDVSSPSPQRPLVGGVRSEWPSECSLFSCLQVGFSLLHHNQQYARSAASAKALIAAFLFGPVMPMFWSNFHDDWAGKPLAPTSTGNSQALHLTVCRLLLALCTWHSSHDS